MQIALCRGERSLYPLPVGMRVDEKLQNQLMAEVEDMLAGGPGGTAAISRPSLPTAAIQHCLDPCPALFAHSLCLLSLLHWPVSKGRFHVPTSNIFCNMNGNSRFRHAIQLSTEG